MRKSHQMYNKKAQQEDVGKTVLPRIRSLLKGIIRKKTTMTKNSATPSPRD